MPRKAFLEDVTSTSNKGIESILDVKRGDDDGDVNFVFVPASGTPIAIGLLALGTSFLPICNFFCGWNITHIASNSVVHGCQTLNCLTISVLE